ncbi:MAG: hypothetical protein IJS15_02485, partial [Victivallales bacterium]|nr:hypothetical protein [Victivallales bacterium]
GWYNSIPTTIRYSVDNLINEIWQPSDLTHKIVLKEIKNPIPMFQNSFYGKISIDTPVGFDLFTGDFVSPNKKGRNVDFFLTYGKKETEEEKIETLTITFPNKDDGVYRAKYNYGSEFRTAYEASAKNEKYKSKMVFQRKIRFFNEKGWGGKLVRKGTIVSEDNINAKDEYLVIRTRSIVDLYERHISSYYSRIYNNADSGIEFADGNLSFHWRTNPFLNDRNLETRNEYKPSIIQLRNSGILYDGIDRSPINPEYYKYESVRKCLVVFLDDAESAHLLPLVLDNCNKYGVKPQLILRMMNQKQGEVK